MNVLTLTNPKYRDFLTETIFPYQSKANIYGYSGNNKVADWEGLKRLTNYDVGISFMYQHKVPAKEVNTHTWFNFHPAPLPEYKGRNLCYHAIMNGEEWFGATLHYMDENFDTGDIIRVVRFPIHKHTTAEDLSNSAIWMSQELFKEYFPRILAGEKFERFPNVGGTYYPKEKIGDEVWIPDFTRRDIRAITHFPFYPVVDVGGVKYKIVKDE